MTTTCVVADLLRTDLVWRCFFKRCCALGAFRLRAQAWQFRVGLAERGVMADLEDVQDVLLVLASKTLPDSPAGRGAPSATAVIETERQAFTVAHDYFGGRDQRGGAA